jgi:hypothetical protein
MRLSQAQSQSGDSMKPLGTNNAAENGLTTPKALLENQSHSADFQQSH